MKKTLLMASLALMFVGLAPTTFRCGKSHDISAK